MQNELNKYFKGTLKSSSSLPNRTIANVMDMIQKIPLSVYTYRRRRYRDKNEWIFAQLEK